LRPSEKRGKATTKEKAVVGLGAGVADGNAVSVSATMVAMVSLSDVEAGLLPTHEFSMINRNTLATRIENFFIAYPLVRLPNQVLSRHLAAQQLIELCDLITEIKIGNHSVRLTGY